MSSNSIFKQPKIFFPVFLIILLERSVFYGFQVFIPIFFNKELGIPNQDALSYLSIYLALIFCLVSIGGYIGDRFINKKQATVLGLLVLIAGYIITLFSNTFFFSFGIGCIIVGNSIFMPNLPAMLASGYNDNDIRIDPGFTLYYMAINVGSFIGYFILTKHLNSKHWISFFTISLVFLILALATLLAVNKKNFFNKSTLSFKNRISKESAISMLNSKLFISFCCALLVAVLIGNVIKDSLFVHFTISIAIILICIIGYHEFLKLNLRDRRTLLVIGILMLEALIFFIPFWQTWNIMNHAFLIHLDHKLFGFEIGQDFFRKAIPILIVIFSPVLAITYNYLANKKSDLHISYKFSIGIILYGFSFFLIWFDSFSNANGSFSTRWMFFSACFQSLGELLVSGLGLAMVARLAPKHLIGFLMGAWFMTTTLAIIIGNHILNWFDITHVVSQSTATYSIYRVISPSIGLLMLITGGISIIAANKLSRITNYTKVSRHKQSSKDESKSSLKTILSEKITSYTFLAIFIVSIGILVSLNFISRKQYHSQQYHWLSLVTNPKYANDHSLKNIMPVVASTKLFKSLAVFSKNRKLIYSFDTGKSRLNLNNLHQNKLIPVYNRSRSITGYYYYQSNYNHYFLPFLWFGIFLLVLIFGSFFLLRRLLNDHLTKEFSKFNIFLTNIGKLTAKIAKGNSVSTIIINEKKPNTDEEIKIQKATHNLIDTINTITKEKEKEKTKAAISKVALQMAHDIRSPLVALNTALADTKRKGQKIDSQLIQNATSRINEIANQLLTKYKTNLLENDLSKAESTLILPLIENVVSEKKYEYKDDGCHIDLRAEQKTNAFFVSVIPSEFKRIVSNLINNAFEANKARNTYIALQLDSSPDNSKVFLTLSDNGAGFKSKYENTPVTNLLKTIKSEAGTGLGLTHANEMLLKWNCTFFVTSIPEQGTTFKIALPRAPAPYWIITEINIPLNATVVILDDDSSVIDAWTSKLSSCPDTISIFTFNLPDDDFYEAIGQKSEYLLLISDFQLNNSKLSGLDVLESIKNVDQTILSTSYYDSEDIINECKNLDIKILPKNLLAITKINFTTNLRHSSDTHYDLVLIDNDPMIRSTWGKISKIRDLKIITCSDYGDFKNKCVNISKSTPIYIDYQLSDNVSGATIAEKLYRQGFENLYIASGYDKDELPNIPFVKEIIGKEFPL